MAGPESPAPVDRAPGAGAARIRCTQTPCAQACAAPTVSRSSPLRPVRADTPGTPATPESPSIPYVSTAECSQKRHLTESPTFECFHEFLRRAPFRCRHCPDEPVPSHRVQMVFQSRFEHLWVDTRANASHPLLSVEEQCRDFRRPVARRTTGARLGISSCLMHISQILPQAWEAQRLCPYGHGG